MKNKEDESGSSSESFAQRMLRMQGWTEGTGLGKTNQGIAEPIRPHLKFDTSGMGHDPAKEFTDHWWNDAFNKAVGKIKVTQQEDGSVDVEQAEKKKKKKKKRKNEEDPQTQPQPKPKPNIYAGFVKTATLTNGVQLVEEPKKLDSSDSETDDDEDEKPKKRRLTDEEMFKACKGMTAHKGARHGHKMKAKLQRIADMEEKLLKELQAKSSASKDPDDVVPEKKKKKKKEKDSSS